MKIRRMTQEDVVDVAAIEKRTFPAPWSRKAFADALDQDGTIFLVAEETGRILGYVGMYVAVDEGEITNVAVDGPFRRHGVASALLQVLQEEGRLAQVQRMILEVRTDNKPAIGLYEMEGFRTIGVRKDFYQFPRGDAFLMELYL